MAMEPINIYSRRIDPRGVLAVLRSLNPAVEVVGPDDDWHRATITLGKDKRETRILTFTHDSEYYDDPDWPQQVFGMQGYFARFPESERKADVLRLIGTFRFALATDWEPDLEESDDERLKYLVAVTEHLDGAIFTPSSLRDAHGRILIASDGGTDPDAVLPQMPPAVQPSAVDAPDPDPEYAEEEEPEPPSADRVVRRALGLAAVTARALAEQCDLSEEGIEEYRQDILAWIATLGLEDELDPDEWKVLQRPVGKLDQQAAINATWRLEGLGVLAWTLGRFDVPPHDVLVDPQQLLAAMCFLDVQQAQELLAAPRLRTEAELDERRRQTLAVHWRLRDYTLRPQAMDFREFAETCWFGPLDIRPFRLIDGDLALGDSAIADAPQELFSTCISAAHERHLAINWLSWGGAVYSETDTST